jgi:hypothetical protein
VHHQRFTVDVDDGLEQRGDEIDFIHRIAQVGTPNTTDRVAVPACVSA